MEKIFGADWKHVVKELLILTLGFIVGLIGIRLALKQDTEHLGIFTMLFGVAIAYLSDLPWVRPKLLSVWVCAAQVAVMIWPGYVALSGKMYSYSPVRLFELSTTLLMPIFYLWFVIMPATLVKFFVRYYQRQRAESKERDQGG